MREKMSKQEKKDRKAYRKLNKKHMKALKNLLKHYGPWDNFIGWFAKLQFQYWIDYYGLGYNVNAMEIKDTPEFNQPDRPTRLQIALQMKALYDKYQDMTISDFKRPDGSIDSDKYDEAYEKAKREFFEYYMEYADDMWD